MPPRIAHVQMGRGGGTERFFVNLVQAFAEAGSPQLVGMADGVDYAADLSGTADIVQGPFLRRSPGGLLARRRLSHALRAFRPDAMIGWRAPTGRLIPNDPGLVKLVRLGDYPGHVRHFSHLDAVVCNNPDIADHITGLGHSGRVDVISNFARPGPVAPVARAALATPDTAFVVCGVGRFAANKGMDVLLRAAAQLPEAWLWLVGDGPERTALEALADTLGIADRVRFAGWSDEPMRFVAAADAFVMPSRDEPLGNALIEAWHAGTAAVSTRTAGPNWYASDDQDCLLVDVDDAEAMARALSRLRSDPKLRSRLIANAKTSLKNRFSREAVVAAYFELVAELAQKAGARAR